MNVVEEEADYMSMTEGSIRAADDIARRALILSAMVAISIGEDQRFVKNWLCNNCLLGELSPKEMQLVSVARPTRQQIIDASWHIEALLVLLWALGMVKEIPAMSNQHSFDELQKLTPLYSGVSVIEFISTAQRRPRKKLIEMYDKIWNEHWKVRKANRTNMPKPNHRLVSTIQERHRAINWILNCYAEPWDVVTCDT